MLLEVLVVHVDRAVALDEAVVEVDQDVDEGEEEELEEEDLQIQEWRRMCRRLA
jgi:hypothetical protein